MKPHWIKSNTQKTLGTIYRQGWRIVASKPGYILIAPINTLRK